MRVALVLLLLTACENKSDKKIDLPKATADAGSAHANPAVPAVEQVTPKIDIKTPPADATKTSSGLIYKKLADNPSGKPIARNDIVKINYVGWRHTNGETFANTRTYGQPIPLDLSQQAAGFAEGLQLVKTGETVMLWVPPEIGYKGPSDGTPEMLVYEIEVVDVEPAMPVPADHKAPPAGAKQLKAGAQYIVVKPGSAEKPRYFDTVTFDYTAWDSTGRMFDSTEKRKRPAIVPVFKQAAPMYELLPLLGKGQRVRMWVDSAKMTVGKSNPLPPGLLCYEIELKEIERAKGTPPPAPADVKAPPADTQKTARGVAYKIIKPGKGGPKPGPTDSVKLSYTAWSTDGRMVDSSVITGSPATIALNGTIAGLTEGLGVLSAGDRARLWIPDELAYKGAPDKPQGMLVYDVEIVQVVGADDGHGHGQSSDQPAPPDVAAPPKDAKKSPQGAFYKILKPGKKGGAKPTKADTITVHYTGWTTDGKQFDSTIGRDPAQFRLDSVITGWTDIFPLLTVGDRARFWIPQELAYQGQEGAPKGMLVFDVELVEIVKP